MATADATLEVVRGYHRAWPRKNFDQAGRYLARDLITEVPINTYNGREQFLDALTGSGRLVSSVDLVAESLRAMRRCCSMTSSPSQSERSASPSTSPSQTTESHASGKSTTRLLCVRPDSDQTYSPSSGEEATIES